MVERRLTYPYPNYQGERVLGVGFTRKTGLGYIMGTEFAKLGAELIVGGSTEGSVAVASRNFQRAGIDQSHLSSFVADLRDSTQIDKAVASLTTPPTIVVYTAAVGMEGFFLSMHDYLSEMKAIKEAADPDVNQKITDKKRELREKLEIWLPQGYADALAVNRTAPEYLVSRLVSRFNGTPFRFVYVNSTFGYLGAGPIHYRNVYETKHQTSQWMSQSAEDLARAGVEMHEDVDPVIFDTDVGITIIEDIAPFWPERVQQVIDRTKVSRGEVFGSVKLFTDMTAGGNASGQRPSRHFLVRFNDVPVILGKFPEELAIDIKEFDF